MKLLLLASLVTAAYAFDVCQYLASDPLLSNVFHARDACSDFQQRTSSLCPTTATVTRTSITAVQSIVTKTITSNVRTTTVLTAQGDSTLSFTLTAIPSGPIPGSQDINKRAASCPMLSGPDVPGIFAIFCQAADFASICGRIGIAATTKTLQSTVLVTKTALSTLASTTSTTTTQTLIATRTTTVPVLETQGPTVPYFYLSADGLHIWTGGEEPGSALQLVTYAANLYFSGPPNQNLQSVDGKQIYVNGGQDTFVRVEPVSNRDPRVLKCEFSQATSGNLTCVSGPAGNVTTKFQLCNNDGGIHHAAGLQPGCSAVRVYNGSPEGTG